jgi:hypothetical protein
MNGNVIPVNDHHIAIMQALDSKVKKTIQKLKVMKHYLERTNNSNTAGVDHDGAKPTTRSSS